MSDSTSLPSSSDPPGEFDSDGRSSAGSVLLLQGASISGTMVFSGCGGQHKVSLAHNRQLMFSNLEPSWMFFEHLLKTVHMPNRDSIFRGFTWCIFSASSVRTGAIKRGGILADALWAMR